MLSLDLETMECGGKTYRTNVPGATMLIETLEGNVNVQQACDELPAVAH